MRPKNRHIYVDEKRGRDIKWLRDTERDYVSLGFHTQLKDDHLTVFALPPRKPKKKDDKDAHRSRKHS